MSCLAFWVCKVDRGSQVWLNLGTMKKIYVSLIVQYFEEGDAFRDYYELKNPHIEVSEEEIEEDEDVVGWYAEDKFAGQIAAIIEKHYYGVDYTISGGDYDEEEEIYMLRVNIGDDELDDE